MNFKYKESKEICDTILNQNITVEFLNKTATNLKPCVLAEVVTCLKKHAQCPKYLNEILTKSNFSVFDIVGTGGTNSNRINTSTLTSIFAQNFGINIIKHGGRSSKSKIGAIDFIESLGISLEENYHNASEYFRATGIVFLAAAYTYPIFAKSAPIRKQVTQPTIFNLLGPLLNPINVKAKLIGAYNENIAKLMAKTCQKLNENCVIVTSYDSEGYLDEASPFSTTILHFCKNKNITSFKLEPIEISNLSRTNIFSDSLKATKSFLSFEKSETTNYITKLIAYNLSILITLNEFIQTDNNNLNLLLEKIPEKIKKIYLLILSNFDSHIVKANEKISSLANLKKIHSKSPILVENDLVNIEINHEFNFNNIESFFSKDSLFIAEVKISRPQQQFTSTLSLEQRIQAYSNADAISVVTHPSFNGSLNLLKKIRKLTNKPILAKDFINASFIIN